MSYTKMLYNVLLLLVDRRRYDKPEFGKTVTINLSTKTKFVNIDNTGHVKCHPDVRMRTVATFNYTVSRLHKG